MPTPRPMPSFVHRRPPPDANAARRQWRALADDARAMGRRAGEGGVWLEPLGVRHEVARAPALPADRGDALAMHLDTAFREIAKAMLNAGTDERRAIVAPVLLAAAGAVDALLDDIIKPAVALSRRISGDFEED